MASQLNLRVLRKLGTQPKAEVVLCEPLRADYEGAHEQPVVVKRFHVKAVSSPASVDDNYLTVEAEREISVVNKLLSFQPHPHIVRYHSINYKRDHVSITMEHCERGDLLLWLHQQPQQRFPETQALAIFRQILRAVSFLHNHDIAHRDLSLENCLVAQDHTIKICDFGLATSASTPSRQHVGKLNYMAPEVVRGDYYDPVKADVRSLGIVLFMLLTGSTLYRVASHDDVVFACVQSIGIDGALRQWDLEGVVSKETVKLMLAMLHVDVEQRLGNIQAIEAVMA